jgi:hypothetical protein
MNDKRPENIRAWYERKTSRARRSLVWATALAAVGMFVFWFAVPHEWAARLQTANGGYTIPAFGALWIAIFMFVWLIPMRELSFRGQEAMEHMESCISEAFEKHVKPAVDVWRRVGEKVEIELPKCLQEFREGLKTIKESAVKMEAAVTRGEEMSKEAKAAVVALTKISDRVDKEIKTGFIEEIRTTLTSVREMTLPPGSTPPDLRMTLDAIRARRK